MTLGGLVVRCVMKVVSKLPDWCDWQWRWQRRNWRRISTHDRDDLVAVDLQTGMEAHDDVVGEDALGILLRSASFQRKFDLVAEVAFSDDLTGAVTIEVGVGDAVKLIVEFQIHLYEETPERETQISDNFCAKKKRFKSVESCYAHSVPKLSAQKSCVPFM